MNRVERTVAEIEHRFSDKTIRLLDMGCGFGEAIQSLSQHGFKNVVGIDYLPAHIERAHQLVPQAQLLVADAQNLPFADGSFDAVITLDVIEHVASDAQAIREATRVLKSGGVLIVTVPHRGFTTWLDPANILFKLTGRREYHRHYTAHQMIRLLGDNFSDYTVETRGLGMAQVWHILSFPVRKLSRWAPSIERWISRIEAVEYAKQTGRFGYHLFVSATKR